MQYFMLVEYIIGVLALCACIYLVWNSIIQFAAQRNLMVKIKTHKNELTKIWEKELTEHEYFSQKEQRIVADKLLIKLLSKEIKNLPKYQSMILKKTLDRKSENNQRRYAWQLFFKTGVIESFGLNKNEYTEHLQELDKAFG